MPHGNFLTDTNGNTLAAGATIPDGKYDVMISAYSPFTGTNNPTNTQYTFVVDNEPPVFTILRPAPATISLGVTIDSQGNPHSGPTALQNAAVNPYARFPGNYTGPATMVMAYSVTDAMSPMVDGVTFAATDPSGNVSPFIAAPTPMPVPFENLGSYSSLWTVQNLPYGTEANVIFKVGVPMRRVLRAGLPSPSSWIGRRRFRVDPPFMTSHPFATATLGGGPVTMVNSNTVSMGFPYHFGTLPGVSSPEGGTAIFTF